MADTKPMVRMGRVLSALVAAIACAGTLGAPALAALPAQRPNLAGTYNGQINQLQPKAYTGHIHFVVSHGRLSGLRFSTGTLCGLVWVVDTDHNLGTLSMRVGSDGAFSYQGTVAGRQIRLRGTFKGKRARGTFFTAFPWGQSTCTMGEAASFTATR